MKRQLVLRLKKKHKYIMYVIKKVAQRVQKTGMKFVKYHGILHMMEDILLCGVPMEFEEAPRPRKGRRPRKKI